MPAAFLSQSLQAAQTERRETTGTAEETAAHRPSGCMNAQKGAAESQKQQ